MVQLRNGADVEEPYVTTTGITIRSTIATMPGYLATMSLLELLRDFCAEEGIPNFSNLSAEQNTLLQECVSQFPENDRKALMSNGIGGRGDNNLLYRDDSRNIRIYPRNADILLSSFDLSRRFPEAPITPLAGSLPIITAPPYRSSSPNPIIANAREAVVERKANLFQAPTPTPLASQSVITETATPTPAAVSKPSAPTQKPPVNNVKIAPDGIVINNVNFWRIPDIYVLNNGSLLLMTNGLKDGEQLAAMLKEKGIGSQVHWIYGTISNIRGDRSLHNGSFECVQVDAEHALNTLDLLHSKEHAFPITDECYNASREACLSVGTSGISKITSRILGETQLLRLLHDMGIDFRTDIVPLQYKILGEDAPATASLTTFPSPPLPASTQDPAQPQVSSSSLSQRQDSEVKKAGGILERLGITLPERKPPKPPQKENFDDVLALIPGKPVEQEETPTSAPSTPVPTPERWNFIFLPGTTEFAPVKSARILGDGTLLIRTLDTEGLTTFLEPISAPLPPERGERGIVRFHSSSTQAILDELMKTEAGRFQIDGKNCGGLAMKDFEKTQPSSGQTLS